MSVDVLDHLEQQLVDARAHAAEAVDRADALAELRSLASGYAAARGQTFLTADQLDNGPPDEHQRAHLRSLIDRALPTNRSEETHAA